MSQIGMGMTQIPVRIVPELLRRRFVPGRESIELQTCFAKQRKHGELYFSGLYRQHLDGYYGVGAYRREMTPVRLARICGWILPLKAATPLYMVADYLMEEGQEDTNMVRLMKLILNQ